MSFTYVDGRLHAEAADLEAIASEHGTPTFVYSRQAITGAYQQFADAFDGQDTAICYSVKANSNTGVLSLLASLGAGFDIVSGGELQRVIHAGGDPAKVVFSGVGKQAWELRLALEHGIRCFNVESRDELLLLNQVASELKVEAPVSIRVNPDVDAKTHPYIATGLSENKFGVAIETAPALYEEAAALPHIRVTGLDCHIGSQITTLAPYLDAFTRVLALTDELAGNGIAVDHIDIGGGMGIRYQDEVPLDISELAAGIRQLRGARQFQLMMEPGRSIVANAGILLSRVNLLKSNGDHHFAIVDAAMNDLIRPALYDAWQDVLPVVEGGSGEQRKFDVVGPVCESGDFLARARVLKVSSGDLLAVMGSGAYGFVMSSNYNSRPRAAEVIVDGSEVHLVREREVFADLVRGEKRLPGV